MDKKKADKLAKETWGPLASAMRVSSNIRNERFGFGMVEPGGVNREPVLIIFGYGDSFESALEMTKESSQAAAAENRWTQVKADWKEFGETPEKYIERMKHDLKSAEQQTESSQSNGSEGSSVGGVEDQR